MCGFCGTPLTPYLSPELMFWFPPTGGEAEDRPQKRREKNRHHVNRRKAHEHEYTDHRF